MQREIEIRVQIPDPTLFLAFLDKNGEPRETTTQLDVYLEPNQSPFLYRSEEGEVRADKWLRIRQDNSTTALCLKEVERDVKGAYLYSRESEVVLSDINAGIAVLERLDFKEVIRVQKRRTEWACNKFIVAKDEIEGLGTFFEIEIHDESLDFEEALDRLNAFLESSVGSAYERVRGGYPQLIWSAAGK